MSEKNTNTLCLMEGALMIALATLLSFIKFYDLPMGGSITLEMVPLVIFALRRGPKWGIFTGLVHGILQMILGFSNVMYCPTLLSQVGCILLDYILAFSALGVAGFFTMKKGKFFVLNCTLGAVVAGLLRFACSFLSGWLLWGSYAPEGWNVAWYSFVYNISYMGPNIIILAVVTAILIPAINRLKK